jgi:hypothetical protein
VDRWPEIAEITIDTRQHTAGFFVRHGFCTTQQVTDGFGVGIDKVSMSLQRNHWRGQAVLGNAGNDGDRIMMSI